MKMMDVSWKNNQHCKSQCESQILEIQFPVHCFCFLYRINNSLQFSLHISFHFLSVKEDFDLSSPPEEPVYCKLSWTESSGSSKQTKTLWCLRASNPAESQFKTICSFLCIFSNLILIACDCSTFFGVCVEGVISGIYTQIKTGEKVFQYSSCSRSWCLCWHEQNRSVFVLRAAPWWERWVRSKPGREADSLCVLSTVSPLPQPNPPLCVWPRSTHLTLCVSARTKHTLIWGFMRVQIRSANKQEPERERRWWMEAGGRGLSSVFTWHTGATETQTTCSGDIIQISELIIHFFTPSLKLRASIKNCLLISITAV